MWNGPYRTVSYVNSTLWTIPFLVLVLAVAPAVRMLDGQLGWNSGLGVAGAQALYQTVITLTASFLVFTFGSLLVALQVASGQLTPRIIATTLLRDNVLRYTVGLFVFSLIFAVIALDRLNATVHEIVTLLTAVLGISCIAAFLFLIDHAARLLRPVSVLACVGDAGLAVIESVYPHLVRDRGRVPDTDTTAGGPRRVVRHAGPPYILMTVDCASLVEEAQESGGIIEVVPQIGDFVADGEPLFVLYGRAAALDDRIVRSAVAFGTERTMEEDPLFSFRIIVDIALKALSPAINDPTTAVLALDQIHRLLRAVGKRQLHAATMADGHGHRRLIYRTPSWEDFVCLACIEIRRCGAGHVQIARRLRAMLDDLSTSLPPYRRDLLNRESRALTRMLESLYTLPDDLTLARVPDLQGLGASGGFVQAHRESTVRHGEMSRRSSD
jgi:uncharacterized membrane protein